MYKLYDCIIIGGGPAGLSAAIYLARFNRSVIVIDSGSGRWNTREVNENYLGFPKGVEARKLRLLGLRQARKFGANYISDKVIRIKKNDGNFNVTGCNTYIGRKLIMATGVKDTFPVFDKRDECIGRSLFWCITCDGYKTQNKKVLVIGNNKEAFTTALQFLQFTKKISVVTNQSKRNINLSVPILKAFKKNGLNLIHGKINTIESENGFITSVKTDNLTIIQTDFVFNLQGSIPGNELFKTLKVKMNSKGFVITDDDQKTNKRGIYAAGDITKRFSHQIASAVHEGAMAAQAVNFSLYSEVQKGEA